MYLLSVQEKTHETTQTISKPVTRKPVIITTTSPITVSKTTSLKTDEVEKTITTKLKKLEGSWKLEFPTLTINIVIKSGKVTLDGKTIIIKGSKNKKYPFSHGWITFDHEGLIYYIRITLDGSHVVRINKNGEVIKGKVGK